MVMNYNRNESGQMIRTDAKGFLEKGGRRRMTNCNIGKWKEDYPEGRPPKQRELKRK